MDVTTLLIAQLKKFQFGNRTKMLIQGKEKNLVMQAYLGNHDIYWR